MDSNASSLLLLQLSPFDTIYHSIVLDRLENYVSRKAWLFFVLDLRT
jgi:hypothetical protein